MEGSVEVVELEMAYSVEYNKSITSTVLRKFRLV